MNFLNEGKKERKLHLLLDDFPSDEDWGKVNSVFTGRLLFGLDDHLDRIDGLNDCGGNASRK
jgi:hypothetical protein